MLLVNRSRTTPPDPTLRPYLQTINEEPTLDAAQEIELARRVAEGDVMAREQLARANLRLVVSIARCYTARTSLDDLIEEGNLGLLRAMESYDPSRGVRFGTYAAYWIRQSIRRGLMNSERVIRLPAYTNQLLSLWRQAAAELTEELSRTPDEEEIAARLGWSARKLALIRRILHSLKANFQTAAHDGDAPLEELVDNREEEMHERPDLLDEALELLDRLEPRDALVLKLRYGLDGNSPRTLQEVGDELGLTRARISQIEKAALRKLREQLMNRC